MKFQIRQHGDAKVISYSQGIWTLFQYVPIWKTYTGTLEDCKNKIKSLKKGDDIYPLLYEE